MKLQELSPQEEYFALTTQRMHFLTVALDFGELLLIHGAEAGRVEDTMQRLCKVYGFQDADVFTITSSIVVTVTAPDQMVLTQTRRIRERDTDLGRIERLNALSRRFCSHTIGAEELEQELQRIKESGAASPLLSCLMYMMISASLTAFFGGTPMDSLAASISGLALFLMIRVGKILEMNSMIQLFVCCAVTAGIVLFLEKIGLGQNSDKILIGNIMLVIPGIQLTSSLRDLLNGDTISGLLNMSEAVIKAVVVALGFALVLFLGGQ